MVFEHPSQLKTLTPLLVPRREGALHLGGIMAEHPQRAAWERDLNRAYHACGCDTGAAGMIVGTCAGIIIAIAMFFLDRWTLLGAAGAVFLFAFAGAAAGKIAGVIKARSRMGRIVREIENAVGVAELEMKQAARQPGPAAASAVKLVRLTGTMRTP